MDRKNDEPRRLFKWLGLPPRLMDRSLARKLGGPQRLTVRVIDIESARARRDGRAKRSTVQPGGAA